MKGLVRPLALVALMMGTVCAVRAQDFGGGQLVRGTVTAVSSEKLTVRTETGESFEVVAGSNARVMKARQPIKLAEFKVGESVAAAGQMDVATKTLHALFVTGVDPEQEKKLREGLGKVYIAGKITAIDETKLTIERPDKVVQVIEVDEETSFRKGGRMLGGFAGGAGNGAAAGGGVAGGGESITLADFKVGDNVVGPGALKNNVFVPAQLNLVEQRQRRRPGASATPAPTNPPAPK